MQASCFRCYSVHEGGRGLFPIDIKKEKTAEGSISEWQPENGKRIIDQARDSAEKEIIINVLEHFDGNKSRAAEYLGIARPVLYQKMKRLGIKQEF